MQQVVKEVIQITDKEQLKNIYRQVNQAMVNQDIEELKKLLTATSTLRHMTGYIQPCSEWLAQIESGQMRYDDWQEERIKEVIIDQNQATLIGQSLVTAKIWGAGPSVWPLQIKMYFVKINGKWLITKQEASTY